MRIPKATVDAIYQAADIVEVIGDYVQLKKKGQNYVGLSPFKAERTPSFTVSPNKQIFKDFSSGKGGNAVNFLMELEQFSYVEALTHIAQKYGIPIEVEGQSPDEARGADDRRASLYALNNFAAGFFRRQLTETEEGRSYGLSYFRERGFSEVTMEAYSLGYSPEAWDGFTAEALKGQYKAEYLMETGLSAASEKTGQLYDRFRGRVMFPIHDARGRVAGFGGRILRADEKTAKYLNSPESLIYDKSNLLYGLYHAQKAIREAGECILVEGYTDVISLHQAGLRHVVASSGTALTANQVALIARYAKRVLLLYDGDAAGVNAALRGLDLILARGLAVKILQLPGNHDPDSYVKAFGGAGLRAYAEEHALDFLAFKLQVLGRGKDLARPEEKQQMIAALAESIAQIPDEVGRGIYANHAATLVGIPEQLALSAVNKVLLQQAQAEQRRERPTPTEPQTEPKTISSTLTLQGSAETYHQERELVRLLLNYAGREIAVATEAAPATFTVAEYLADELDEIPFLVPAFEHIRRTCLAAVKAGQALPLEELMTRSEPEIGQHVAELQTNLYTLSENWQKQEVFVPAQDADLSLLVVNAVLHFKLKRINQYLAESKTQLQAATAEDQMPLLARHTQLDKLRMAVAQQLSIVVQGGAK